MPKQEWGIFHKIDLELCSWGHPDRKSADQFVESAGPHKGVLQVVKLQRSPKSIYDFDAILFEES